MCMKLMESASVGELPKGKVRPLAQLVEQRINLDSISPNVIISESQTDAKI